MIAFMVLSAPRSGSTWAANWLTTSDQLCLHDPIFETKVAELDSLPHARRYGIACSALPLLTDWVNKHPAPKLILHRPLSEVNASLVNIGLTPLSRTWDGILARIEGFHVNHHDMFRAGAAELIWNHLCPETPFDRERHALLKAMHIDPHFPRVRVNPERAREFRDQLTRALG